MNIFGGRILETGSWISNKVNRTMIIIGGTMISIYGTMSIVGGTMNSIYGTMSNIVGSMSNGDEVVEPYMKPWTKFIENEKFRGGTMNFFYGTMDNYDRTVSNAGGNMYLQNHMQLRNLE